MKTLIFNGSPRKNGDTISLLKKLESLLIGDCKVLNAYSCNIAPCVDCRYCHTSDGCCINDGWQELDEYIKSCDNIIIASPNYFSELSGQLLAVTSRLQSYWIARHYRNDELIPKKKLGGIILVGGGDGNMSTPAETATCLLNHMNARTVFEPICCHKTDIHPAIEDELVLEKIEALASFLNTNNQTKNDGK